MTVPAIPKFDDFIFRLWNLSTGAVAVILNPASILNFTGKTVPGVGDHRLQSASFEVPYNSTAADQVDFSALQLLQVIPYGAEAWSLWGFISKPDEGYSQNTRRDSVKVQVLSVESYILGSRLVYHNNAGVKEAISITAGKADDFAKKLVRYTMLAGTCANDLRSYSRDFDLGTLVVEADAAECAGDIAFLAISEGYLLDALEKLSQKYEFAYQFAVSISGGTVTFTFKTQAPYGGSDLTSGNDRVWIKDIVNLLPSASRYRELYGHVNAVHSRDFSNVAKDDTAITAYGRREGIVRGEEDADLLLGLEEGRVHEGSTYEFNALGANGTVQWLEDFKAGDYVNRINNRLGIASDSEVIAAITFSFPRKRLHLEIEWGDREPGLTDRMSNGGGGDWSPLADGVPPAAYMMPTFVGGANAEGSGYGIVREDHVHKGVIQVEAIGEAVPADGVITVQSTGNTIAITRPGANTVNFEGVLGASCYWQETKGTPDFLHQRDHGNDVKLFNAADGLTIHFRVADGKSWFADDMIIGANSGVAAQKLHIIDTARGDVWLRTEGVGGAHVEFGMDGDNRAVIRTGGEFSISFQPNSTEIMHLAGDGASVKTVNAADFGVCSDALGATVKFSVAGATGNTAWAAGAKWTIEGDQYTLPAAFPGTTGMALVGTTLGVLSWANPLIATPGTLTVATGNVAAAPHTHAITSSADPGAAASLLATDANGYLELVRLRLGNTSTCVYLSGTALIADSVYSHQWYIGGTAAMVLTATYLRPNPNNTMSLGTATPYRWTNVYAYAANIDGNITVTGTVDGVNVSSHTHRMNGHTSGWIAGTANDWVQNIRGQSANYYVRTYSSAANAANDVSATGELLVQHRYDHYHNLVWHSSGSQGTMSTAVTLAPL